MCDVLGKKPTEHSVQYSEFGWFMCVIEVTPDYLPVRGDDEARFARATSSARPRGRAVLATFVAIERVAVYDDDLLAAAV